MVADAVHSLSDFVSDIAIILTFRIVKKPIDKSHDYGHGKFETLSTFIVGLLLLFIGIGILRSGILNVIKISGGIIPYQPRIIAFYAAVISVITKEWLYRYTAKKGKEIKSDAIIANAWHHRTDAFTSVGTMIGIGLAVLMGHKWVIFDPIAAIMVSIFILKISITIILKCTNEFMEASLSEETENKILKVVRSVDGVTNPHNLKTRKIGKNIAIDIHIEVDRNLNIVQAHNIASAVENKIKEEFGEETFISVHTEPSE